MRDAKTELYIYESLDEIREWIQEKNYTAAIAKGREVFCLANIEEEYGDYFGTLCRLLAMACRKNGMPGDAKKILERAENFFRKRYLKTHDSQYYREYGTVLVNLGIVNESIGLTEEALGQYGTAEEVFEELKDDKSLMKLCLTVFHTYLRDGQTEKAGEMLDKAVGLAESGQFVYDKQVLEDYKKLMEKRKHDCNQT